MEIVYPFSSINYCFVINLLMSQIRKNTFSCFLDFTIALSNNNLKDNNMADLDLNIKGNNEKFIKEFEQIRSSIKSITIELKNVSNESNGFANVLKKTFDMLGGKEACLLYTSFMSR